MDDTMMVATATAAFVGTHFLLSHPLRKPLVRVAGEMGFMGIYAVVAFATLGWMAETYRKSTPQAPLWDVGDGLWAVATVIMLLASVLLLGSLIGNPAMPNPKAPDAPPPARGVFTITRHPMMWSFALWGVAHILVFPTPANIVLCAGIMVLALVGSALQDKKKAALRPGFWQSWEAQTSYWPFGAIIDGRARLGGFRPHDIAGGLIVWLAATWAHQPLAGYAAGIWRWFG